MMRPIDVSHTVYHGLETYPGLPAPIVCDFLSREQSKRLYAEGTTFQIARVELVANTGTYVDAPFHRYEGGADLAGLDLAALAHVEGIVVSVAEQQKRAIDANAFAGLDVRGKAVLVHTGWDRHWETPAYFAGHPFLIRQAAEYLRDNGARIVGIDSLNIDDTGDGTRPVHTILLGAGIPIVEHLCCLQDLPPSGFRFHAVPVKFQGVGTFPVRAYAITEDAETT
jgi:kynurenine formamidase